MHMGVLQSERVRWKKIFKIPQNWHGMGARMHTMAPAKWCLSGCLGLISAWGETSDLDQSSSLENHHGVQGTSTIQWVGGVQHLQKWLPGFSLLYLHPQLCGPTAPLKRWSLFSIHDSRLALWLALVNGMWRNPYCTSSKPWLGEVFAHIPWPSKRISPGELAGEEATWGRMVPSVPAKAPDIWAHPVVLQCHHPDLQQSRGAWDTQARPGKKSLAPPSLKGWLAESWAMATALALSQVSGWQVNAAIFNWCNWEGLLVGRLLPSVILCPGRMV